MKYVLYITFKNVIFLESITLNFYSRNSKPNNNTFNRVTYLGRVARNAANFIACYLQN